MKHNEHKEVKNESENKCKRITALVLSAGLTLSMLPMTSMPVHAATTKSM